MVQHIRFLCVRLPLPAAPWLGPAALAVLAGLFLAACGGTSGCGGTGGGGGAYQVDNLPRPGLLNCSMTPASSTAVNPNSPTALAAGVTMSVDGTPLTGYPGSIPPGGASSANFAFSPTAGTATGGMTPSYTLNASKAGMPVYCEIAGGGIDFYSSAVTTSPTTTLTIAYPPFTMSGTFTVTCDAFDGAMYTAQTSLTVTATP